MKTMNHIFEKHFSLSKRLLKKAYCRARLNAHWSALILQRSMPLNLPLCSIRPLFRIRFKAILKRAAFGLSWVCAPREGHISPFIFQKRHTQQAQHLPVWSGQWVCGNTGSEVKPFLQAQAFQYKLKEMKADDDICTFVLNALPQEFSKEQLVSEIRKAS